MVNLKRTSWHISPIKKLNNEPRLPSQILKNKHWMQLDHTKLLLFPWARNHWCIHTTLIAWQGWECSLVLGCEKALQKRPMQEDANFPTHLKATWDQLELFYTKESFRSAWSLTAWARVLQVQRDRLESYVLRQTSFLSSLHTTQAFVIFALITHNPTCLVAQMLGHYDKFTGKN